MSAMAAFRTLVGKDAPCLLVAAGWHIGMAPYGQHLALWHERLGDVLFAGAPDALLEDYLLATIDSPHVEAVIAVLGVSLR